MIVLISTGKTHVITTRIAFLIEALSIRSDNIIALTFTNKAVGRVNS